MVTPGPGADLSAIEHAPRREDRGDGVRQGRGAAALRRHWSKYQNPLAANPQLANPFNNAIFAQFLSSALKNQGLPDIFSSMALQYAGFRLNKRDITRLGWRANGATSVRAGTGQAVTEDDLNGNQQTQTASGTCRSGATEPP